ncbi:MAG: hypothetical protein RL328_722, partial [Acidobacteriota bacterium]
VAAFWEGHPHHERSFERVSRASKKGSACGAHSLAEIYATLTALPVSTVIEPGEALFLVEEVSRRLTIVTLTERDYVDTIERAAGLGHTSGRIYDALLLSCAGKFGADVIYSWNIKHFASIDPRVAQKVKLP